MNSVISHRVLREAYGRLGIEITVSPLPGARAIYQSSKGVTDGELYRIWGISDKHPTLVPVPVPINVMDVIIFTIDTPLEVQGWNSLNSFTLGMQRGVKFAEKATSESKDLNVWLTNTNEQLFKMLIAGRVDIVAASRVSGLNKIKELGVAEIKPLDPAVESYQLYHYLHKKNSHLIPALTSVLEAMQNEGLIDKIRADFIQEQFGHYTAH